MSGRLCERYELEKDQLNKSPELAAVFEEHRDLIEYVSTRSGAKMTKDDINEAIVHFAEVYDTLLIEVDFAREIAHDALVRTFFEWLSFTVCRL